MDTRTGTAEGGRIKHTAMDQQRPASSSPAASSVGRRGGAEQPLLSSSRESIDIVCQLSDLLRAGLNRDAVVAVVDLLESGLSPDAVASAVLELRKEVEGS
mmetsp:Transcript_13485/g.29294  ORF Transcript_13485/g.29294 Transcript_13485/m.29294 type:complete len:101 (-) Transcript_13485:329-631(-)